MECRTLFATTGGGLLGTYHSNENFTGATFARQDEHVTFNFGTGEIAPGVGADTASIRWIGRVKPAYSETYTFKVISDDGARLWVNSHLLFDTFDGQGGIKVNTGQVHLRANRFYDIRLEYRERTGPASIQMRWRSATQYETLVPVTRLYPPEVIADDALRAKLGDVMDLAQAKYKQTLADLAGNTAAYPELTDPTTGRWRIKSADDWTSGFFPGVLWQLQRHTHDRDWRLSATAWTQNIASQVNAADDVAFRFMPTYLNLYRAMERRRDRLMVVAAAESKIAQFDPTVGMFRSVNFDPSKSGDPAADFPVLIDHSMDMQIVYWAAKSSGNLHWIDMANSHLSRVIEHFIRPDGGAVQWGYFNANTGDFVASQGRQGYADETTWSRGHAWLLYSLTNAGAETGRADFLAAAKRMADYWLTHVGADMVPNWDFDAPSSGGVFKDSSAAAVAASALLQLAGLAGTPDGIRYRHAAEATLSSLASVNYLDTGTGRGLLKHGARWVAKGNVDDSLIYGDYYFLEAINRYNGLI